MATLQTNINKLTFTEKLDLIVNQHTFIESGNFRIGKIVKVTPDIVVECDFDKIHLLVTKFDISFPAVLRGTLHVGQTAQVYRTTNSSCTLYSIK